MLHLFSIKPRNVDMIMISLSVDILFNYMRGQELSKTDIFRSYLKMLLNI